MIYLETSALVAILLEENDARELAARLQSSDDRVISVVSVAEAALAIGKNIRDYTLGKQLVLGFLDVMKVRIISVTPSILDVVIEAASKYGRGAGHPARLNFGDLFSYAVAKQTGSPILFKGNDFSRTDLIQA